MHVVNRWLVFGSVSVMVRSFPSTAVVSVGAAGPVTAASIGAPPAMAGAAAAIAAAVAAAATVMRANWPRDVRADVVGVLGSSCAMVDSLPVGVESSDTTVRDSPA
ncbi:hypothetical protein GCM10027068_09080 [Prescottella soli]